VSTAGKQALKRAFTTSDDQRLSDLYMSACNELFDHVQLEESDVEVTAHFLGSEAVARAAVRIVTHGEVDEELFAREWTSVSRRHEKFTEVLRAFVQVLQRTALENLPIDQRMGISVARADMWLSEHREDEPGVSTSGSIEGADERIASLESALLREFAARLDEAVKLVKESKQFRSALAALQRLADDAKGRPEVVQNGDVMNKLFINMTVCAERLGDFDAALDFATKAVEHKAEDPRSLTNLAVAKVKRSDESIDEATQLVERALHGDPEYRPALLLRVSLLAQRDGAVAAVGAASEFDWVSADSNAQYALSLMHLKAGSRESALECARRAVDLESTPEHLAWLAHLVVNDKVEADAELMEFKVRGVAEPDRAELAEAVELLRRAAGEYAQQERRIQAEAVRIDQARMLIRLDRDDEAKALLEETTRTATADEVLRAAYSNLVELTLPEPGDASLVYADEACAKFPADPHLRFGRARALAANGRGDEAIEDWRAVSSNEDVRSSLRDHARVFTASTLLTAGRVQEARAELDATDLPNHPFAVITRARLHEGEGNLDAARQCLLDSAAANAVDAGLLLVAADFLRNRGFEADAASLYQQVLPLLGDEPASLTGQQLRIWAEAAYFAREFERCAGLDLTNVRDEDSRNELRIVRASALEQLSRFDNALHEYESLSDALPEHRDVVEGLTHCAFQLGRPDRAIPYLERLAQSPKGRAYDYSNLAALYAIAGDIEASTRAATRAIELAPDDRLIVSSYIVLMLRNGRVDDAAQRMVQYVTDFPDSDAVQVWHGSPDELSQRFINEIFVPLKEQHEKVGELYAQHPLPIGLMAKNLGRSYVNLWYGIRAGELGGPLRVGRGAEFQHEELDAAADADVIVLDQSAMLTLGMLKMLSVIPERFPTTLIPQSAIDGIREELLRTEDELLRNIIETVERHQLSFLVVPVAEQTPDWLDPEVKNAFGQQEYDSLALAREKGIPLLSDDLGMRDLAKSHDVTAFSTRALLELARRENIIDGPTYGDAVVGLIRANYYFVSYNGYVLGHAMRRNVEDAEALLALFGKPDANLASYGPVFSGALCEIWTLDSSVRLERSASEWSIRLLWAMLSRGGLQQAIPMLLVAVACIWPRKPEMLPPLMLALCDFSQLPDENVMALVVFTAIGLADSARRGQLDTAIGQAFVKALSQHWRGRLRRILRHEARQAFELLFARD
jgi:tetratricopeptide (TPR) repeat protein/predicted nucleic acid-binding protein